MQEVAPVDKHIKGVKSYFVLQGKLVSRKLSDAGIHPLPGFLLAGLVFLALWVYLFSKVTYAPYVFVLVAVSIISNLSETRRNEFLKICFGDTKFKQLRVIENLIVALPFILFLCYKLLFLFALGLCAFAVLLALLSFKTGLSFTIPTPFYKKPFEFTVGFRNTLYLLMVAYALAGIAVWANNFNLGVFALLFVFAITLSYYSKPENEYFVWSHSLTVNRFLLGKLKTAFLYSTVLILPVLVILGLGFINQIHFALLFLLPGYAFLMGVVLAKYSAYPNEMSLPQGLLLAMCVWFPPALIAVIPYFFIRSGKRLQYLLK